MGMNRSNQGMENISEGSAEFSFKNARRFFNLSTIPHTLNIEQILSFPMQTLNEFHLRPSWGQIVFKRNVYNIQVIIMLIVIQGES